MSAPAIPPRIASGVTALVRGTRARFVYARDGNLWYAVDGAKFMFPIPFADVETATFAAEDKAIVFMRWIRKEVARQEANNG